MRTRLFFIWIILGGAVLVPFRLIIDRTPSAGQLAAVKTACIKCHSDVPSYGKGVTVHHIHSTLTCDRCHKDGGLKTVRILHKELEWLCLVLGSITLAGVITSFMMSSRKTISQLTKKRTVKRFGGRAICMHWLHAMAFAILAITGLLMFFHLANFATGTQVRSVHYVAAAFFGVMLFIYSVLDPRPSLGFLREAFHWERNNLDWLKASPGYYFRGRKAMPPQGRINGDQKLWQLVVILTSIILFLTGVVLWFFQFKISRQLYGGFLLMHALAFILILVTFFWHFYLRTLHPDFSESLSSMINGKVSESYAAEHYRKWHFGMAEPGGDTDSKETKSGR